MKSHPIGFRSSLGMSVLLACAALALTPMASANEVFTFDCDLEGWTGSGSVDLSHEQDPGRMIYTYVGPDSFDPIIQNPDLSLDGSQFEEVAIQLTISGWDGEYPISFFFFSDEGVTQIPVGEYGNGEHLIRFNAATQGTGNPAQIDWSDSTAIHTIRFDMPDNIDYPNVENATVEVDWIAVTDDPEFVPEQDTSDCSGGSSSEYVGDEKVWFMPLDDAPTVDATQDAVWDNLPWYRMSDILTAAVPASADDISGQFKAGYYGDSIYLFIEVTDNAAYGDSDDQPWQRDSVEVYMDLENVAGDLGDAATQVDAWRNSGGPAQMRFQHDESNSGFGAEEDNMTDDDRLFATDRSGTTTYYEIQLNPPASLDLDSIESYGFLMQVNDSDAADQLDKPVIGWWGGPEQPWGEYNGEISVDQRPWQNSSVFAEAGFTGPLELSVSIQGPKYIAIGADGILQANVTYASGDVSYQWFKDGAAIDGAVDQELMVVDALESDSGVYTVEVSDADENTATSAEHNLVVGEALPASSMSSLLLLALMLLLAGAALLTWKRVRA